MKLLTVDDVEQIGHLFMKYEETVKDIIQFPKPITEIIKGWIESGKGKIGIAQREEQSVGFAITFPKSTRIIAIYVDDLDGILTQNEIESHENELIDWCIQELENLPTRLEIPKITNNMKHSFLDRGYVEYERANMRVGKDEFLKNSHIIRPEGYLMKEYSADLRKEVAAVVAATNIDHVDGMIYPEYFGSLEAATNFLEKFEQNAFGRYKEGLPKVQYFNDKIIGYCMISVVEKKAFVSDLGLLPEYQGKGLGKMLLVNSMLNVLETDDSIEEIELAVTLSNPALHLYEKLGFRIVGEFSAIVLEKRE